ncbi:MAG: L-ribulose-5-phosphate 3-epimerase [Clostridia bacterium]|nr:L-ribulose-5-phosphate 3-epimerase [Clostridia bacterium]NCC75465.1 L-ribulose-5-phosphate 3-epimerase [Clostridia bacterium]
MPAPDHPFAKVPVKLGLYEKAMPNQLTWPAKLAAARDAGYDFVEISLDETAEKLARLDWSPLERRQLRQEMDVADIRIETMCLSGHRKFPLGSPDEAIRRESLQIMAKAVALASDLGIRIIQLAGYDTYYDPSTEQTRAWFAAGLQQCADLASREGIILGFETMETPFMDTVSKAMAYVDIVQSPYLQVYPDIGNLTNASLIYSRSVPDDLETGRGHICAAHLKETIPGHYREIPYGTGHTDFKTLVPKLQDMGVHRFTAEFWHVGEADWQAILRGNAAFLRPFFLNQTQL